jgi:hypothetical protein
MTLNNYFHHRFTFFQFKENEGLKNKDQFKQFVQHIMLMKS